MLMLFNNLKSSSLLQNLLLTFVVTFLIWLATYHWSRRKLYRMAKQFRNTKPYYPIIGHAALIKNPKKFLEVILSVCSNDPTPHMIWAGPNFGVIVCRPDHMECIMTKALSKSYVFEFLKTAFGHGLLTAPVQMWKTNRKLLSGAFSQKILNSYVPDFVENSNRLVDLFKKNLNDKNLNIDPIMFSTVLRTLGETNIKINKLVEFDDHLFKLIADVLHRGIDLFYNRLVTVYYHLDVIYKFTDEYKEMINMVTKIRARIFSILAQVKQNQSKELDYGTSVDSKRKTFIEILLEKNRESELFSDNHIVYEMSTFIAAGTDTTSGTCCFTFIMLAMFPDIQQKAYEEVMSVVGPNKNIEYTDLPKLKYLEMVIKETMRIFPMGPTVTREVHEDLTLPTGQTLPKGTTVILSIFSMHRSAEYYPDPLAFNPERFLPEEIAKRHPYSYLPFSGGPRNCIGLKYAMMAMKTIIGEVLRNFKLHTHYKSIEEIRLEQNITLTPIDGYQVYVTERN